jgi:hypothetical protein
VAERSSETCRDVRQQRFLSWAGLAPIGCDFERLHTALRQPSDQALLPIHKVPEFAPFGLDHGMGIEPQFLGSKLIGGNQENSIHGADIGAAAEGLSRRGLGALSERLLSPQARLRAGAWVSNLPQS